jgi:hypothetical protein
MRHRAELTADFAHQPTHVGWVGDARSPYRFCDSLGLGARVARVQYLPGPYGQAVDIRHLGIPLI